MEEADVFDPEPGKPEPTPRPAPPPRAARTTGQPLPRRGAGIWAAGARLTWVAGLVLALSSFMGWYAGESLAGPTLAVIGWNTGVLGKLVFFIGLAVVALAVLREIGVEFPPSVPESLVVVTLGSLATIFVLIRLISIPDTFVDTPGREIGIWISLLAGIAVVVGGLLRAAEEL